MTVCLFIALVTQHIRERGMKIWTPALLYGIEHQDSTEIHFLETNLIF